MSELLIKYQNLQYRGGVIGWLVKNLFSTPINTALTFFVVYLLINIVPAIYDWAISSAVWHGETGADCPKGQGACWFFIDKRFNSIIYGFYPQDHLWRPNLVFALLVMGIAPLMLSMVPKLFKARLGLLMIFVFPFVAIAILHGSLFGIAIFDPIVRTEQWGGLILTLVLAIGGIALCFPLGILLALGRRSDSMPIVRIVCTGFIEFWRGVPLITVLFMASVMFPLLMPEGTEFDKLARALIGIVLFEAAYIAEVVRGGLQAIPKGQYEAADSLNMSYWRKTGLVILPQALKIVIPGIVNTFIALLKDTSLVSIVGMWDLLNSAIGATRDPNWIGLIIEAYVFAGFIYWTLCFSLSKYSQHLEGKLATERT